jgi:carbon-monoxide dehydrogenase medium subunit
MIPSSFEYQRANSVAEAVALLGQNKDAKLIAGGHSLLPAMKLRLAQPPLLIDISRIGELKGITMADGVWTIGALTTHAEIANGNAPRALKDAAAAIGDVQVRNRGTIGGSLSHSDPASDYPAAVMALGGRMNVQGPGGKRTIAAEDFFVDLFSTALKPDEILVSIDFGPRPSGGKTGTAYVKHPHPASGFAVAGVAAVVATDGNNNVTVARVAVTGACAKAQHLAATESALNGKALNADNIKAAASANNNLMCLSDNYASADYRAHLTSVLARRALMVALERMA